MQKFWTWSLSGSQRYWLEGILLSLVILLLRLPEVFFFGGSLRLTDFHTSALESNAPVPGWTAIFIGLGLVSTSVQWWSARLDLGGSIWQSEPGMNFFFDSVRSGQSPFWNPYSGNGALGPEAAVDLKFSILSLLNALLGGTSTALTVSWALILLASGASLYVFVRKYVANSPVAGIAAVVAFSLNGFATATLSTNYSLSYWLIPIALTGLMQLLFRPSLISSLTSALALACFFSATFFPTMITSAIAISGVLLSVFISLRSEIRMDGAYLVRVATAMLSSIFLSLSLTAMMYIPFLSSLNWTGILDNYESRSGFASLNLPQAIPSILSPSLFLESYNLIALEPGGEALLGAPAFHLGVAFALIASAGVSFRLKREPLPLLLFLLMSFVLARLVIGEPFKSLIGDVPVLGTIGTQYWWPAVMLPFSLLVAVGTQKVILGRPHLILPIAIFTVVCATIAGWVAQSGISEPNATTKQVSLFLFIAVGILVVSMLVFARSNAHKPLNHKRLTAIALCAVFIGGGHLMVDSKLFFPPQTDYLYPAALLDESNPSINTNSKTVRISSDLVDYPSSSLYENKRDLSLLNEGGSKDYASYFYKAFRVAPEYQHLYSSTLETGLFPTLHHAGNDSSKYDFDFRLINILGATDFFVPSNFTSVVEYLQDNGLVVSRTDQAWTHLSNPNAFPRLFIVDQGGLQPTTEGFELSVSSKLQVETVEISGQENNSVSAQISSQNGGTLVLTDNHAPGWKAFVDGEARPIISVDKTFMGVQIPAGSINVEFVYEPPLLWVAQAISATGAALTTLGLLWAFRKRPLLLWERWTAFLRKKGLEI